MAENRRFEKGLVEDAQQGDEEAFAVLLSRIEPMLRAFFISRIGPKVDVDDLVQNTLMRLHRGIADLNDPARLKAFTMKAALFELQDYFRGRYSTKELLFDPDSEPKQVDDSSETGAAIDVKRALAALTDHARAIIELRELGYRYEEIAEKLGTTEAAVKMQVKRAFEKMRDALDPPPP